MNRRTFSGAKRTSLLSAAAAAAAVTLLGVSNSRGGLLVDVLALPGANYTVSGQGKTVQALPGTTVQLAVYAQISGTNNTQLVGNFAGDPSINDTKNDEVLQILTGSFASSAGGLLGNFNPTPGPLTYDPHVAPFEANGSQNGSASDFDSDGDLDIGSNGTDLTNMWVVRSDSPTAAVRIDGGAANGWKKDSGPWGFQDDDVVVNATTSRLRVGTLFFTVAGSSGSTLLNFIPRPDPGPGSALWWQDGVVTGHTPGTDPLALGAPVQVSAVAAIPEPASVGLLGLSGLGLLARRKRH